MFVVALTGNVASGKSTVADLWAREGVPVIHADELARDVVAPGSEGLRRVVESFGPGVLRSDGTLDRAALRRLVFEDDSQRHRLEAILHPLIRAGRAERLGRLREEGAPLAVVEIPLLFEVGLELEYDAVVLVEAHPEERLRRLVEERGIAKEEAVRIVESQMPTETKRDRSDYIIRNDGTREALRREALSVLDTLRRRARDGAGA